jgi:hypothetical protein
MNELVSTYIQNKQQINQFLTTTLENTYINTKDLKTYFKFFPSLELSYIVDQSFKQISGNIFKSKVDKSVIGEDREYLFSKVILDNDKNIHITEPYISSATGTTCITMIVKENNTYVFLDFDLGKLLERLLLIEKHHTFSKITKYTYGFIGFSMGLVAFSLLGYAVLIFVQTMLISVFELDIVFKSVIALTLSLAIFDLAKTILEQEVFFKSYGTEDKADSKVLVKFLTSIIIALSIESLMIVFKLAIHKYDQIDPFSLILGISCLIISLAVFYFVTTKAK